MISRIIKDFFILVWLVLLTYPFFKINPSFHSSSCCRWLSCSVFLLVWLFRTKARVEIYSRDPRCSAHEKDGDILCWDPKSTSFVEAGHLVTMCRYLERPSSGIFVQAQMNVNIRYHSKFGFGDADEGRCENCS